MNLSAVVSRAGPWLAPIVPAYFIYRSMTQVLETPALVAIVAGLTVECVGIAISAAALQAYTWNQEKRKSEAEAPFKLSLFLCFFYLMVGVGLTSILETWPSLAPAAPSVFFLLAGIAYVVIALNGDQERREAGALAARVEEKEERRRAKEERTLRQAQDAAARERSADDRRTAEASAPVVNRSVDADAMLANVRAQLGERSFTRADVQSLTGRGKTSSAEIVKYGLATMQIDNVGGHQYQFRNGAGGNENT